LPESVDRHVDSQCPQGGVGFGSAPVGEGDPRGGVENGMGGLAVGHRDDLRAATQRQQARGAEDLVVGMWCDDDRFVGGGHLEGGPPGAA
jgi:hypothetical protein